MTSLCVSLSSTKYLSKVVILSLPYKGESGPFHKNHKISLPSCFSSSSTAKKAFLAERSSWLYKSFPHKSLPKRFIILKVPSLFIGIQPWNKRLSLHTLYKPPFCSNRLICFFSFEQCIKELASLSITSCSSSVSLYGLSKLIVGKLQSSISYSFPSIVTVPFCRLILSSRHLLSILYSGCFLINCPSSLNWMIVIAFCIFIASLVWVSISLLCLLRIANCVQESSAYVSIAKSTKGIILIP